jgi:hypothetical protein
MRDSLRLEKDFQDFVAVVTQGAHDVARHFFHLSEAEQEAFLSSASVPQCSYSARAQIFSRGRV